jgi:uridine kinase
VVVIDGVFLHRDELAARWQFSVFLDVPADVSVRRMADRDGLASAATRRYVAAQGRYLALCGPRARASVVIDNVDPDAPRIIDRPR